MDTSLFSLLRRELWVAKRLGLLIVAVFLLEGPHLVQTLGVSRDPLLQEVIEVGLGLDLRTPYFLGHFGLLGTFLLYQALCWKNWDWRWKFCTSGMVCGWILLNQNWISGLYYQEHHYFRPLMLLYLSVLGDSIQRIARLMPAKSKKPAFVPFGVGLFLIFRESDGFSTGSSDCRGSSCA